MATLSLRLPDDIDARLERESQSSDRAKSEIVRDAIVEFLARQDRERFHAAIVRAAHARGDEEAIALAGEFLPVDNEALALAETGNVHEPPPTYRKRRRRSK